MSISITDIYKSLFGRKGIADGNVIDMAEHGRVGGVSTGTSFKGVQDIPNKVIIDTVDSDTVYIGEAGHGTATNAASWRIKKVLTSSTITTISMAGGNDKFDKVWDDRTSLTYS